MPFFLRDSFAYGCALLFLLGLFGCEERKMKRTRIPVPDTAQQAFFGRSGGTRAKPQGRQTTGGFTQVAGLRWPVPKGWKVRTSRGMRKAVYTIPAAKASQAAQCIVFYFGTRQGGDVSRNMQRWIGQFTPESRSSAKQRTFKVGALPAHVLTIQGTYLSSIRPMSRKKIRKPNHRMWGAIVQGPQGKVFFKCTGPTRTMVSAQGAMRTMLQAIQPRSTY